MQKQIKNSLTIKTLVLALGAFGSGVLHADWDQKSLDDEVAWIVDHEQELTDGQLDEKMAALPREYQEKLVAKLNEKMIAWLVKFGGKAKESDAIRGILDLPEEYKEKFALLLRDTIAKITQEGKKLVIAGPDLMQKIKILPEKYREGLYDQLNDGEIYSLITSTILFADWNSLSPDDKTRRIEWLVNYAETLEGYELDKATKPLDDGDKKEIVALLSEKINRIADAGKDITKGEAVGIKKRISWLSKEYQEEFYTQLNTKASEMLMVKSFLGNPAQYPIDVGTWWHLSETNKKRCFDQFSGSQQNQIRKEILAGDLDFKVRYFQYLFEHDQERLIAETDDPDAKIRLFGRLSEETQRRLWREFSPDLKAFYFKGVRRQLRVQFFQDLDEAAQERYRKEHHQPSKVRFQSELPGY